MVAIPTLNLNEISNILSNLDNNGSYMGDEEISNHISQITIGIPFQSLNFSSGCLYRGRPNEGNDFFDNIKKLSFPPLESVRCNRFNDDKTQMLYVAELKSTVIEEVKPKPGAYFTIATYTPKQQVNVLPLGILSKVTKSHLFNTAYWQKINMDKIQIYNCNPKYMQIDRIIEDYLYKVITKENETGDPKEYRFTNLFGKHFLSSFVDGLLYPSVTRKLIDINIAIKASAFKKLAITQVDVIKMDDKTPGKFQIIAGSNQFSASGNIVYNNHIGTFEEMIKF